MRKKARKNKGTKDIFGKKDIIFILIILAGLLTPIFTSNTIAIFTASLLAILPLAYYIGLSTEELAGHYSSVVGGLISSTFGNLTELVIAILAVKEGLTEVVKASLTGSIIGNTLFVFGSGILLAGFKYKEQKLSSSLADINSTLLLITMLLFLFPSLLPIFHEENRIESISLLVAGLMLVIYLASLVFSLITHKDWFIDKGEREKPHISKAMAIGILILTSLALVIASENFVSVLEDFSHHLNLNDLFVGVVIVGLVGNVAEHLFAVNLALKNKVDLLITASVGSALQVALFVTPLLVFAGWFFNQAMTLLFTPLEIVSIIGSVLLMNEISKDKLVNWFEGFLLVMLYAVLGILFFFAH